MSEPRPSIAPENAGRLPGAGLSASSDPSNRVTRPAPESAPVCSASAFSQNSASAATERGAASPTTFARAGIGHLPATDHGPSASMTLCARGASFTASASCHVEPSSETKSRQLTGARAVDTVSWWKP